MNKLSIATIALTASLAFAPHAQASTLLPLTDNGTFTSDPNSGLDWHDLAPTAGRSIHEVRGQFVAGGEFDGYRFATLSDINELIQNVTGMTRFATDQTSLDLDFAVGSELQRLFGDTRTFGSGNVSRIYSEGIIAGVGNFGYGVAAILAEPFSNDSFFVPVFASINSNSTRGAFLVRDTSMSTVPVPAAAFMFAPAVLGFLGLRRRAKQA